MNKLIAKFLRALANKLEGKSANEKEKVRKEYEASLKKYHAIMAKETNVDKPKSIKFFERNVEPLYHKMQSL